jgi:hypothetical protein
LPLVGELVFLMLTPIGSETPLRLIC